MKPCRFCGAVATDGRGKVWGVRKICGAVLHRKIRICQACRIEFGEYSRSEILYLKNSKWPKVRKLARSEKAFGSKDIYEALDKLKIEYLRIGENHDGL